MAELADHLGINEFVIFAPSGGGPFALACAWQIPDRLAAVGVFGRGYIYRLENLFKFVNVIPGTTHPIKIYGRQVACQNAMDHSDPEIMVSQTSRFKDNS